MNKKILKNVSARTFWQKLSSNEKHTFFSWSHTKRGWKRIIAFNPVDSYMYKSGQGKLMVDSFCEKHKDKFIAGFLSYDLGYEVHKITPTAKDDLLLPDICFFIYDDYIEFENDSAILNFNDYDFPSQVEKINNRSIHAMNEYQAHDFQIKVTKDEYEKNFNKIINYIKAGDVYQINYTHRMQAKTNINSRDLYLKLLKKNMVNYAAFMEMKEFSVLSLSPESFIRVDDKNIITKPIKGTRPRGKNKQEDLENKSELLKSEKEQAELFMIVDLLRNDLGKVCEIGSVKVKNKKLIQNLPKVIHTYAKVVGILRDDINPVSALLSMFPGGSITGCPKKRAMEIIDELELIRRSIYTGSIGYILPEGKMEFNIAIRTIVQKNDNLYLGVGGGITIESKMSDEFEETLAKAQTFLGG